MESEFNFNELHQAGCDAGTIYYWYKYNRDQYDAYQNAHDYDAKELIIEKYWNEQRNAGYENITGIVDLINDGVIRHPAFIDWDNLRSMIDYESYRHGIDGWIDRIKEPQKRVEIIDYLIKSAGVLFANSDDRKEVVIHLRGLLPKHKAAAKELARQASEERAKNKQPKEKPEYTLSVDEIIQYVLSAGPHTASAISDMLRYFAFEKDGWKKDVIKKKLHLLDNPVIVQGDMVQGNKNEANYQAPVGQVNQNVEHMNTAKE